MRLELHSYVSAMHLHDHSDPLDNTSEQILSKGLSFTPTPRTPSIENLFSDFERFSRSLSICLSI